MGAHFRWSQRLFATQLTVTQYIEIYISSVLAKKWKKSPLYGMQHEWGEAGVRIGS